MPRVVVREFMQGTAMLVTVDDKPIATAKKTPRAWTIRCLTGTPWIAPEGAIMAGRPANITEIKDKRNARRVLFELGEQET